MDKSEFNINQREISISNSNSNSNNGSRDSIVIQNGKETDSSHLGV